MDAQAQAVRLMAGDGHPGLPRIIQSKVQADGVMLSPIGIPCPTFKGADLPRQLPGWGLGHTLPRRDARGGRSAPVENRHDVDGGLDADALTAPMPSAGMQVHPVRSRREIHCPLRLIGKHRRHQEVSPQQVRIVDVFYHGILREVQNQGPQHRRTVLRTAPGLAVKVLD